MRPETRTVDAINKYLEIKARGMIQEHRQSGRGSAPGYRTTVSVRVGRALTVVR